MSEQRIIAALVSLLSAAGVVISFGVARNYRQLATGVARDVRNHFDRFPGWLKHNDWVATTQAIRWWAALFFLSALVLPLEFLGQIWAVFLVFLVWMAGLFVGFFVAWRHNVRAGRVFGPKAARVLELPVWFFLFVLFVGVLVMGKALGMAR